ncbi:MAG: Crp/Fnr family transcriptional regulator [Rubrivivax sp.]|nr:Crp/Fnr family transcriptional regulator [Pyrinomonadaceae bacterium]
MSIYQPSLIPTENRILAALPPAELERLLPHLEPVNLILGKILVHPGEPIRHVYFPVDSLISLVTLMKNGKAVEASVVGREGMMGVPILLNTDATPIQMIVQLPGRAFMARAATIKEASGNGGVLRDILLRYAHALFVGVAQTAACNRLHRVEERLCRWLLICRDCVGRDELQLTQEFMGVMLGVRRSGVTVAAGNLRAAGLIEYTRGQIRILDHERLEQASCECYETVKAEFDVLFGKTSPHADVLPAGR